MIKLTLEEGIKEIDDAVWVMDRYGILNLKVHDQQGKEVHCWLALRQHYCDRGHIEFNIDGNLYIDSQDSFPRYFFTTKEAQEHVKLFLKWRIWKFRVHPHIL